MWRRRSTTDELSTEPSVVRLGTGGFGTTYRISGAGGEEPVVMKLMPEGGLRARLSARLHREIGAMAALSHHEDMVTILRWGSTEDDRWHVAFEDVPGGSLADLVDAGATLDWRTGVRLGVRLARVLELAHGLGVLHRDLKPANILLSGDGRPLLTDLGLGTLSCSFSLDTPAAAESLVCAAPEASRTMALTPRADVYALAATIRLLVEGPLGTRAGEAQEFARSDRGRSERAKALPGGLLEVFDAAMAPEPDDRYPSMAALRRDLELLDDRRRKKLRIELPEQLRRAS